MEHDDPNGVRIAQKKEGRPETREKIVGKFTRNERLRRLLPDIRPREYGRSAKYQP